MTITTEGTHRITVSKEVDSKTETGTINQIDTVGDTMIDLDMEGEVITIGKSLGFLELRKILLEIFSETTTGTTITTAK